MPKRAVLKKKAVLLMFFAAAFFCGRFAAKYAADDARGAGTEAVRTNGTGIYHTEGNWGLSFQTEGKPPVANATADQLARYNACYADITDEKVLYLTFDAGFENGNTPMILDALKKHQVPAAFFLVGNYLETSPDLVKRMVDEGHIVANHTYHHPDMSRL